MFKYRIGLTCPNCEEDIISDGYHLDFTSDDVVMLESFEQQTFECKNCGCIVYTMEAYNMYESEGGEDMEIIYMNGIARLDVHPDDVVITCDGEVGRISSICMCEECQSRGFEEICFNFDRGAEGWITSYDYKANFALYYQIGKYVWADHVDQDFLVNKILQANEDIEKANQHKQNAIRLLGLLNGVDVKGT